MWNWQGSFRIYSPRNHVPAPDDVICLSIGPKIVIANSTPNFSAGMMHCQVICVGTDGAPIRMSSTRGPPPCSTSRPSTRRELFHSNRSSMLYHTARISFNRPFLRSSILMSRSRLAATLPRFYTNSVQICDTSIDVILNILRRFNLQHGLRNASLIFVHGIIVAIDATIAMNSQRRGHLSLQDTSLAALDTALADLSSAWKIANDARRGLRNILDRWQVALATTTPEATQSSSAFTTSPSSISDSTDQSYAPLLVIQQPMDQWTAPTWDQSLPDHDVDLFLQTAGSLGPGFSDYWRFGCGFDRGTWDLTTSMDGGGGTDWWTHL